MESLIFSRLCRLYLSFCCPLLCQEWEFKAIKIVIFPIGILFQFSILTSILMLCVDEIENTTTTITFHLLFFALLSFWKLMNIHKHRTASHHYSSKKIKIYIFCCDKRKKIKKNKFIFLDMFQSFVGGCQMELLYCLSVVVCASTHMYG